jgi:hypothetical protein
MRIGEVNIAITHARGVWGSTKIMYDSNFAEWIPCQGLVACLGHRQAAIHHVHDAAPVPTGEH